MHGFMNRHQMIQILISAILRTRILMIGILKKAVLERQTAQRKQRQSAPWYIGDDEDEHVSDTDDKKKKRKKDRKRRGKLSESDIENADVKELDVDIQLEVHQKGDKLRVPKMGKRPKGKKYTVMSVSDGKKKRHRKKKGDQDVLDRDYLANPLAETFDLTKPIDVDLEMPSLKAYSQDKIAREQEEKHREGDAQRDAAKSEKKQKRKSKKERAKEKKLREKEKRKAKREKKRLKRALKKQQKEDPEEQQQPQEPEAPAQGDLLDDLYGFMGGDQSQTTKTAVVDT